VSTTATPDLAARIQDFWAYHPLLQIAHRETKQLVPLKLNQAQLKLYRERVLAAREGRPFRGNYLKARQVGISTVWQAMTAARAFTRANVRAITLAHDDQTTDELHSMLEAMYEHLPAEMKPKQRSREQGKRIVLEYPNGQISRIRTRTAGARVIGRGMNFTDIHASEVAFWPDIAESNTALNDAIQELPGTNVLRESTANGKANPFYAICRNSKAVDPRWADWCTGESDWLFFFTPWYDDAGYTMTVPEKGLGKLSDEEDYLRREFMVSDEQLQWRRWRIANKYDGDVSRFWQEMPSWPEQAFLATGRRYFAENSVSRIVIRTPKRGELRGVYPAPYAFTQHDEGRSATGKPPSRATRTSSPSTRPGRSRRRRRRSTPAWRSTRPTTRRACTSSIASPAASSRRGTTRTRTSTSSATRPRCSASSTTRPSSAWRRPVGTAGR
jgi:hypothetical protein